MGKYDNARVNLISVMRLLQRRGISTKKNSK